LNLPVARLDECGWQDDGFVFCLSKFVIPFGAILLDTCSNSVT
jgi:hypothetical protein